MGKKGKGGRDLWKKDLRGGIVPWISFLLFDGGEKKKRGRVDLLQLGKKRKVSRRGLTLEGEISVCIQREKRVSEEGGGDGGLFFQKKKKGGILNLHSGFLREGRKRAGKRRILKEELLAKKEREMIMLRHHIGLGEKGEERRFYFHLSRGRRGDQGGGGRCESSYLGGKKRGGEGKKKKVLKSVTQLHTQGGKEKGDGREKKGRKEGQSRHIPMSRGKGREKGGGGKMPLSYNSGGK